MSATRELLIYLDSIQSRYPYGIPRLLGNDEREEKINGGTRVLDVLFVGKVSGDERELLNAAITKGLKCKLSQVEIFDQQQHQSEILTFVTSNKPRCVVFLGAQEWLDNALKTNLMGIFGGVPALVSYELNKVLLEPAAKRAFWEDLKKVMSLLRTNSWA